MPETAIVHVQKSRQLAELLYGSGGHYERLVNQLGNAASPGNPGMTTVTFHDGQETSVARGLTALLLRARAGGNPSAAGVEGILVQLGAEVPAPVPEPPAA